MNRSAAMTLFLPLLLVLLLATGGQATAAADEPSTSHGPVPGPSPSKVYFDEPLGESPATNGGHRTIKIGPCFPNNGNNGNALSCPNLCISQGYAGGHCDPLPGGQTGDCYCVGF